MPEVKKIAKRKPGRPATIEATEFVGMRLPKALLDQIDKWAKQHKLDRSAAARALLERGLGKD